MFGNPETTTGGNALKFYASVRMDIRRIGAIKDRDEVIGNQTRVKIVKNKLAPPFKTVEFDIMYGEGISKTGEILDLASKDGIVEKSGAWYSYNGDRIGQGRENSKTFLNENPEILEEIKTKLLAKFGLAELPAQEEALISTEELEEINQIMVKQLKNRYNDPTINKRFVVGIDRAKMRLYDVEQSAQNGIIDANQDVVPKDNLSEKFAQLKV